MRLGVLPAVLPLALAACAARVLPPSGNTAYGVYPFHQVVTNASPAVTLEGTVTLMPDTVLMSLVASPCTPSTAQHNAIRSFSYQCGTYLFSFSKQNPLRDNSYGVPDRTFMNNRICLQTAIVNGRETCVRYGTERVEVNRVLTGKITFVAK